MLAKIGLVMLAVMAQLALFAGLVLYETGIMLVEVQEKTPSGHHFYIPVPVALLHAGLLVVPEKEMQQIQREIEPRKDLILGLCAQLRDCPDGPYLEYKSAEDEVTVKKEDGDLIVLIDTNDEKVRVEVPIFAVNNLLAQAM